MYDIQVTDEAALIYMQEGMLHGVLKQMGLNAKPRTKDEILGNTFLTKLLKTTIRETIQYQGQTLLADIAGTPFSTVLDIGCGLGLCSISLHRYSPNPLTFFMVDGGRSYDDSAAQYMDPFRDDGTDFVSDLRVTMDMMLRNGIPQNHINFLGPKASNVAMLKPESIDLVVSNVSWFYHYPPEVYWDAVRPLMHDGSMLRVDIRWDHMPEIRREFRDFLVDRFEEVHDLRMIGTGEHPHSLCVLAKYPR